MALTDYRGVPLSSSNQDSIDGFEQALALFQGYAGDPVAAIDAVLERDPGFVMGHLLRAGMMLSSSERAAVPEIRRSFEAAEAQAHNATPRERGHMAAIEAWLDGQFHRSIELYGKVLLEEPHDAVALQVAHLCNFLTGQSWLLRDQVARALPFWSQGMPGYGFLHGMLAFGLEEMGDYAAAETAGETALALNPADAWAAHAVAHVMEMQGRLDEGIDFLNRSSQDWAEDNFFAYHNFWHKSLYHLDRGDTDAVLDLYDTRIHPGPSEVAMELVDAAALLWRMHLRGHPVGERWNDVAESFVGLIEDRYYPFNDLHATMAFVATERWAEADAVLANVTATAKGNDASAMMAAEVGLPAVRAFHAFGRGDYATTVAELLPIRPYAGKFGGSHAQRDVLSLTLIEAALRDGQTSLARGLAAERTTVKPGNPFNWALTARAAEQAGDGERADAARLRAM
ncbi:MAG: tetratricopeptide repeat protein [Alphaproteobacteria bacterium]